MDKAWSRSDCGDDGALELHMGLCGSDFRRGSCASHRRDSKTDSGAWMCVPRSVHGDVKA